MFLKRKIRGLGVETAANKGLGNKDAPNTIPPKDNHLRRVWLILFIMSISLCYFMLSLTNVINIRSQKEQNALILPISP